MSEERRKILEMVESGRISAEQAAELLDLVSESSPPESEPATGSAETPSMRRPTSTTSEPRPYWRQAVFIGAIVMVVGGAVLADAYQRSGVTVWTWLFGWLPLFMGLLIVTIAAWARTARWVQMRISSKENDFVLSFPLPLGLGASLVSFLRPLVPQMRHSGVDELILALREGLPDDEPITIEVDNEEEGEHVQIRID